jgi:gluconolactonase
VSLQGLPAPNGGRQVTPSPGGQFQKFDSMAIDTLGNVCVATLFQGGITVLSPDGSRSSHVALPDAFTTNLCFGGPDRRTAYVTLSGTGKLIAIDDWPIPGLQLAHEA